MTTTEERHARYRRERTPEQMERERARSRRYRARKRGEDVPLRKAVRGTCSIAGCGKRTVARGWCRTHYYRWSRTGDPLLVHTRPQGLDADGVLRWTGWTETALGCWEWAGTRSHAGYGTVRFAGRKRMAHRLAYETWVGAIPAGLLVRHKHCDNPPCINPAHLEVGTQVDNMRDMAERGRGKHARGSANHRAKLTEAAVQAIRAEQERGVTMAELARRFEVSETLIRMVVRRTIWRHVS